MPGQIRRFVLLALVLITPTSCKQSDQSSLSEVVGRSVGERILKRNDKEFVFERYGPRAGNKSDSSRGIAVAEFREYERFSEIHREDRQYIDFRLSTDQEKAPGTEEAWFGYFVNDRPQRDRPELLAEAVVGISLDRARAISRLKGDDLPLSERPKGWKEFKKEMKKIDRAFKDKKKFRHLSGVFKDAIVENGKQNIFRLGYKVKSTQLETFWNREPVEWSVYREEFLNSYRWRVPVEINITGVKLLPTEREKFVIKVSEERDDVAELVEMGHYGEYQVTTSRNELGTTVFNLVGNRIAARPDNHLNVSIRAVETGIEIEFIDTVANQLKRHAGDVVVKFSLRRDVNNWLAKKNYGIHELALKGDRGTMFIPIEGAAPDWNFSVTHSMARINTTAYDANKYSEDATVRERVK